MKPDRPVVLITGSSGLLGYSLCERLAADGYEVFGFDRVGLPEPPKSNPHVHDIECDLTSYENVRGAMEELRKRGGDHLASVVHMAAYYDFSGADSPLYDKVTVEGTDRLLNALESFNYEQFIFTSTMLVHQPCDIGEQIREDSPLEAKWPYPQSKIKTERLIREGHPDVPSVLLRVAGVYTDYGQQPTLVQQIKRIYERELQSHVYPGDTSAGQSGVHLEDAVDAIARTVQHRRDIPPKTAILIGEAEPPSYDQLQDAIGKLIHGHEWTTLRVPQSLAKAGAAVIDKVSGGEAFIKPFMVAMADDHYALDISRAHELLDWAPKHHLIDDLPKIVQKLLDNPDQWYRENGLEHDA